ncbi:MAG: phosphate ABC transporter substrate-binding protein [Betaproteobacteria bacterium]|nr:phosphate ABC transporter substrate-binding protein [Betaproteobacteria bacterium]
MDRNWSSATVAALATFILLGLGCPGAAVASHTAGKLLITGSGTMTPLIRDIAKRYEAVHPGVRIEIQSGGSGRGLSDARTGKADIGMVSRALSDRESDLTGFPIARDGVALVVHKDNPVRALTNRQVADIYTGRITNWKQVGGRDAAIAVFAAESGRSTSELFTQFFEISYADIRAHQVLGDNPSRIRAISENPSGIVFMSVGEAERTAQAGAPIKLLPMEGVLATSKTIRSGDYPIARALSLVTKSLPTGLAKEFVNFCLSPQVADLIIKHDFVPYQD